MQPTDNKPKQMITVNIAAQLKDGVPALDIYKDLINQFIPTDEIHAAFAEMGYPQQTIEQLAAQVDTEIEKDLADKSIEEGKIKEAQYGGGSIFFPMNISQANKSLSGYRPARNWYLPEDLGNRGNVLGAAATAAEAFTNLFGGKDTDGDGLKDGSLRNFGKKKARHKDRKGEYYSYEVEFDPNDPNIDQKTGKNLNYALNISDLYKGKVDTLDEYKDRLDTYSRINVDPKTGKYTGILSADKIDERLYSDEDVANLKGSISLGDFQKTMAASPDHRALIAQQLGLSGDEMPEGTTYGVDKEGRASAYANIEDNPYLRETMLGQNIYGQTSLLSPAPDPGQQAVTPTADPTAGLYMTGDNPPFAPKQVQNADQQSFRQWYAKNAIRLQGKNEAELRDMFVDESLNKQQRGNGERAYLAEAKEAYDRGNLLKYAEHLVDENLGTMFSGLPYSDKNQRTMLDARQAENAIYDYEEKLFEELGTYDQSQYSEEQKAELKRLSDQYQQKLNTPEYKELEKDLAFRDQYSDPLRHTYTSAMTAQGIRDKVNKNVPLAGFFGLDDAAGFIGANVLGAGHEASVFMDDSRPFMTKLKESGKDMYNNLIGSVIGTFSDTPEQAGALTEDAVRKGYTTSGRVEQERDIPIEMKPSTKEVAKNKKGGEPETLETLFTKIKDPIFKQAFMSVVAGPTPVGAPPNVSARMQTGGDPSTLYEYYKSLGEQLPSIPTRRGMFTEAGLGDQYSGTAAQNRDLLNYLQNQTDPTVEDPIAQSIMLDEVTVTAQGDPTSRLEPLPIQPLTVPTPELIIPENIPTPDELAGIDATADAPTDVTVDDGSDFADPKVKRKNKFFGTFNYMMDSPGMEAFRDIGTAGVATAGVINEMATARRAAKARQDMRTKLTLADRIYGTYEEREGDRGMWDVNTGLAQPDNLVVGYAQMGKEVFMNPPAPKKEDIVDLDMETITALIAAGADLEIL